MTHASQWQWGPERTASYDRFASGSTRVTVLRVGGEYTSRSPGFVPVANVQLLSHAWTPLSASGRTAASAVASKILATDEQ